MCFMLSNQCSGVVFGAIKETRLSSLMKNQELQNQNFKPTGLLLENLVTVFVLQVFEVTQADCLNSPKTGSCNSIKNKHDFMLLSTEIDELYMWYLRMRREFYRAAHSV